MLTKLSAAIFRSSKQIPTEITALNYQLKEINLALLDSLC